MNSFHWDEKLIEFLNLKIKERKFMKKYTVYYTQTNGLKGFDTLDEAAKFQWGLENYLKLSNLIIYNNENGNQTIVDLKIDNNYRISNIEFLEMLGINIEYSNY